MHFEEWTGNFFLFSFLCLTKVCLMTSAPSSVPLPFPPVKSNEILTYQNYTNPNSICIFPPRDLFQTGSPYTTLCSNAFAVRVGDENVPAKPSESDNTNTMCLALLSVSSKLCEIDTVDALHKQFGNNLPNGMSLIKSNSNPEITIESFCGEFQKEISHKEGAIVQFAPFFNSFFSSEKDGIRCTEFCNDRHPSVRINVLCSLINSGLELIRSLNAKLEATPVPSNTDNPQVVQNNPGARGTNLAEENKVISPNEAQNIIQPAVSSSHLFKRVSTPIGNQLGQSLKEGPEVIPPNEQQDKTSSGPQGVSSLAQPAQQPPPEVEQHDLPKISGSGSSTSSAPVPILNQNQLSKNPQIVSPNDGKLSASLPINGQSTTGGSESKVVSTPPKESKGKEQEIVNPPGAGVEKQEKGDDGKMPDSETPFDPQDERAQVVEPGSEEDPDLVMENDKSSPGNANAVKPPLLEDDKASGSSNLEKGSLKNSNSDANTIYGMPEDDIDNSGYFGYFITFIGISCFCFIMFHNKKRLIALVVEGRKPRGGRRRSTSGAAAYRKLENNFE